MNAFLTKKHYYLIVDTETTCKGGACDFGAVLIDRKGEIVEQFGMLVSGQFGTIELFSDPSAPADSFWSEQSKAKRLKGYYTMLDGGERSIGSPTLINNWLAGVIARYKPVLTAYNINFDLRSCKKVGINLGIFNSRFCLMKAAKKYLISDDYNEFCFKHGLLTKNGRPQTKADTMAKFILGIDLEDEPHCALEDARDYEAPILARLLRELSRKKLLEIGN